MATKQFTGAQVRADHPRLTAPLSAPAAEALSRLEYAFLSPDAGQAVDRHKAASAVIAQTSKVLAARALTDIEADDFDAAQNEMRAAKAVLAEAGRLDLIGVAA